jgi:streptogramin lyase
MAQAGNGGSGGANTFVEFPIPTPGGLPWDITTGPDGNLWFTEQLGDKVGRITPSGVVTEFPVPTAGASPWQIVTGPDGNLWFTERSGNKIGRITPAGAVTEFTIPDDNTLPEGIAAGADGRLWFTETGSGFVGAVTTAGVFSKYPFPSYPITSVNVSGITAGPDGALWFTYSVTAPTATGPRVGRMTTAGQATEFPLPSAQSTTPVGPNSRIVSGPGGNLWFTMDSLGATNYIGVASTSGAIMTYAIPAIPPSASQPVIGASACGIAAGPDGNLWFAERAFGAIVRMTPSGTMTEVIARSTTRGPCGITAGPDGNIWFTKSGAIGRTTP